MLDERLFRLLFGLGDHFVTVAGGFGSVECRDEGYSRNGSFKKVNKRNKLFLTKYLGYKGLLEHQRVKDGDENVFIRCYPLTGIVDYFILDFDGDGDLDKPKEDVYKVYDLLLERGFDCFIVFSGSKGYHLYCQIPKTNFSNDKALFIYYWKFLIDFDSNEYETLDENHWHNGLGGNIRLIGSIHPKTGECVRIVEGDFSDGVVESPWHSRAMNVACKRSYDDLVLAKRKRLNARKSNKKLLKSSGVDLDKVDLRDLFSDLFGDNFGRRYGSYLSFRCPWHSDDHPSLRVYDTFFVCDGCGVMGNVRTLLNKGVVSFDDLRS